MQRPDLGEHEGRYPLILKQSFTRIIRCEAKQVVLTDRLIRAVDWFIPVELRESTATFWRARIFVISHILGPFSAIAILGYLYGVVAHDWVFWILSVLCGSFWTLPFALNA